MSLQNNNIAVSFLNSKEYPSEIPFDPPEYFPEYWGKSINPLNQIYARIRDMLYRLGLDVENYNTQNWNPLKDIVKPGMTVFLKPNLVRHNHLKKKDIFSVIIHASVLRPIMDYVAIALKNKGRIIIGESQAIFGQFDKAIEISRIKALYEWYRRQVPFPIECVDLRLNRAVRTWLYGKWGRVPVEEDQRGYQAIDFGNDSCFKDIDSRKLRIGIASYRNMLKYHSNGRHEYIFPNSFLKSDVVINVSKLKTHRRTGVTLALKNAMGIPAMKDCLPHYLVGSKEEGGDNYIHSSIRKKICTRLHDEIQSNPLTIVKFFCAVIRRILWNTSKILPFKDEVYEAMWLGNDTLWRTIIDLNRIAYYADKQGKIQEKPQRNSFCIIDGIVSGDKNGPVSPDAVYPGVLLAGFNPVAVDTCAATLMGFDINKIPMIKKALETRNEHHPLFWGNEEGIRITDSGKIFDLSKYQEFRSLNFEAPSSWKNHIELI